LKENPVFSKYTQLTSTLDILKFPGACHQLDQRKGEEEFKNGKAIAEKPKLLTTTS
jgi:hypothetical protein